MSAKAGASIIQVRYQTPDGAQVGPFPIYFDPDVALFREQKQILQQMPTNWVEFREYNGLLIYFTTLVTYRCAITELRYGLDGMKPLQRYDLPQCNAQRPLLRAGERQALHEAAAEDEIDQPADRLARRNPVGSLDGRAQLISPPIAPRRRET